MTGHPGRPPLRPEVIAKILELYFEKGWGYKKIGAKLILAQRGYDTEWTNDSDRTPFGITQTHYIQNHDEDQAESAFMHGGASMRWAT